MMVCATTRFSCPEGRYPKSVTEAFECSSDHQCPKTYKCCDNECFLHKVCQTAIPAISSTTENIITTPVPSTQNILLVSKSTVINTIANASNEITMAQLKSTTTEDLDNSAMQTTSSELSMENIRIETFRTTSTTSEQETTEKSFETEDISMEMTDITQSSKEDSFTEQKTESTDGTGDIQLATDQTTTSISRGGIEETETITDGTSSPIYIEQTRAYDSTPTSTVTETEPTENPGNRDTIIDETDSSISNRETMEYYTTQSTESEPDEEPGNKETIIDETSFFIFDIETMKYETTQSTESEPEEKPGNTDIIEDETSYSISTEGRRVNDEFFDKMTGIEEIIADGSSASMSTNKTTSQGESKTTTDKYSNDPDNIKMTTTVASSPNAQVDGSGRPLKDFETTTIQISFSSTTRTNVSDETFNKTAGRSTDKNDEIDTSTSTRNTTKTENDITPSTMAGTLHDIKTTTKETSSSKSMPTPHDEFFDKMTGINLIIANEISASMSSNKTTSQEESKTTTDTYPNDPDNTTMNTTVAFSPISEEEINKDEQKYATKSSITNTTRDIEENTMKNTSPNSEEVTETHRTTFSSLDGGENSTLDETNKTNNITFYTEVTTKSTNAQVDGTGRILEDFETTTIQTSYLSTTITNVPSETFNKTAATSTDKNDEIDTSTPISTKNTKKTENGIKPSTMVGTSDDIETTTPHDEFYETSAPMSTNKTTSQGESKTTTHTYSKDLDNIKMNTTVISPISEEEINKDERENITVSSITNTTRDIGENTLKNTFPNSEEFTETHRTTLSSLDGGENSTLYETNKTNNISLDTKVTTQATNAHVDGVGRTSRDFETTTIQTSFSSTTRTIVSNETFNKTAATSTDKNDGIDTGTPISTKNTTKTENDITPSIMAGTSGDIETTTKESSSMKSMPTPHDEFYETSASMSTNRTTSQGESKTTTDTYFNDPDNIRMNTTTTFSPISAKEINKDEQENITMRITSITNTTRDIEENTLKNTSPNSEEVSETHRTTLSSLDGVENSTLYETNKTNNISFDTEVTTQSTNAHVDEVGRTSKDFGTTTIQTSSSSTTRTIVSNETFNKKAATSTDKNDGIDTSTPISTKNTTKTENDMTPSTMAGTSDDIETTTKEPSSSKSMSTPHDEFYETSAPISTNGESKTTTHTYSKDLDNIKMNTMVISPISEEEINKDERENITVSSITNTTRDIGENTLKNTSPNSEEVTETHRTTLSSLDGVENSTLYETNKTNNISFDTEVTTQSTNAHVDGVGRTSEDFETTTIQTRSSSTTRKNVSNETFNKTAARSTDKNDGIDTSTPISTKNTTKTENGITPSTMAGTTSQGESKTTTDTYSNDPDNIKMNTTAPLSSINQDEQEDITISSINDTTRDIENTTLKNTSTNFEEVTKTYSTTFVTFDGGETSTRGKTDKTSISFETDEVEIGLEFPTTGTGTSKHEIITPGEFEQPSDSVDNALMNNEKAYHGGSQISEGNRGIESDNQIKVSRIASPEPKNSSFSSFESVSPMFAFASKYFTHTEFISVTQRTIQNSSESDKSSVNHPRNDENMKNIDHHIDHNDETDGKAAGSLSEMNKYSTITVNYTKIDRASSGTFFFDETSGERGDDEDNDNDDENDDTREDGSGSEQPLE
ncbi:unnamed protein product [Phaedon cochleariae]|uniref:WAP domain-containing protein n=1 Tax=Phaedon cochleariae TaxID=80249 RepID=A0A9P0GLY2_PHACE|nr:unnamed protein product [Phaedon cochleariae]